LDEQGKRRIRSLLRIKRVACKLGNADGAEIAEAALVLPFVFMLLLGIVWFGRAFNIYSTIQQAAQQGAITAARNTCASCGDATTTAQAVDTVVSNVLQASNLNPSQILPPVGVPTCGAGQTCNAQNCTTPSPPWPPNGGCATAQGGNIYVCQNVQINPVASGGTQTQPTQCGAVVNFQYPFQFYLPFTSLNLQEITLTAQAQSRMED
jgi:Flp pilus assembly protein TadG